MRNIVQGTTSTPDNAPKGKSFIVKVKKLIPGSELSESGAQVGDLLSAYKPVNHQADAKEIFIVNSVDNFVELTVDTTEVEIEVD